MIKNSKIVFFIILIILFFGLLYYFFDQEVLKFNSNKYVTFIATIVTIIGGAIPILSSIFKTSPSINSITTEHDKTHAQLMSLMEQVEHDWIQGVLEDSIHHAVLLEIGKELQPAQVECPWGRMLELPAQENRLLTVERTISQVFKQEASKLLLILGEPGSGKTTTLLELAKELIAQVRENKQQVIPVIFNLSSWSVEQKPLSLWLADELKEKYYIPKELGDVWLKQQYLLPLLDGLDEVQASARDKCVNEINVFAKTAGITGLAVCCRAEEYQTLPEKLGLKAAIRLQPLRRDQIHNYINSAGDKLIGLSELLEQDAEMKALAESPLMLSVMSFAYYNVSAEEACQWISQDEKRSQLFDRYIGKMFSRRKTEKKIYPDDQIKKGLSWLAAQMQQRNQTVFLVENLQPDWLPIQLSYRLLRGLFMGLFVYFCLHLVGATDIHRLIVSVCIGLLYVLSDIFITPKETLRWSWTALCRNWINPWKSFWWIAPLTLLPIALSLNLQGKSFLDNLPYLATMFVILCFFLSLFEGLENQVPNTKWLVNQGIIVSFQNFLRFGIPVALVVSLLFWPVYTWFNIKYYLGLVVGFALSFVFFGGESVFCHYTLRLLLFLERCMVFNFVGFLNYSSRLILLRKVGGGYLFVHRLLLEHFAKNNR